MKLDSINYMLIIFLTKLVQFSNTVSVPLVINTWPYIKAAQTAWEYIINDRNYIDAFEAGCTECEYLQCDETVGYGGNTDENGESTLDALIYDGATMDMGAVGGIRHVKNAVSVARHVLENTEHSLLVGDLATQFAVNMGFQKEILSTNKTIQNLNNWKVGNCQPNFWKNVEPDPHNCCGPYEPTFEKTVSFKRHSLSSKNHDTIGMIVIDKDHNVVAGTTTNGPKFKIPGRVGDSALPGAGAYADNSVGAAVATGNGDVMMRFLPSFLAVEEMRRGKTPLQAAKIAIKRIVDKYPKFYGAVIVANVEGKYAAACNGMKVFPFSFANPETGNVRIKMVKCKQLKPFNKCRNNSRNWPRWTYL